MDFAILGPLEVRDGGAPIAVGGAKQRGLLALLLLNANEVVSSDRLIDELWGGRPPATAGKALQVYVSGLRKALGRDRIATAPPGYRLAVERDELDLERFERLAARGRSALEEGDPRSARELLDAGLSLWRGPALADFAYERFARLEAERLEERRLAALEARLEADLRLGRHGELVAELGRLVAEHPLRERLRGQLMVALYRSGRQADALAAYRSARETLVEELGIEPSATLRELERAILDQDPALGEPATPAVPSGAGPTEERKLASAVCLELGASGPEEADPERLRALLDRAQAEAADEIAVAGGRIETRVGGSVFATFGAASAHEDHAARALHAARAVRDRLQRRFGDALRVAIGVESGELLVAPEAGRGVTGAAVSAAVQLAHAAAPGDIRVGPRASAASGASPAQLHRAFVGRDEELDALAGIFARVVRMGRPHFVTIVGDAGVGKTTLVRALERRVAEQGVRWYVGSCPAYGRATTYRPLAELVRERLAGTPILGLALGLDAAGGLHPWEARERLHDALVDVLGELAAERPAVVVVEDLHWGDDALLDVLDRAVRGTRGPLLIVGTARPELAGRPRGAGSGDAARIWLEPLSRTDAARMLSELAGPLPAGIRELVLDSAEGNPFFVEEALRSLLDRGVLRRESAGWRAATLPERLETPETITGVIAARIDLLPPAEKATLQAAAVIGRSFWDGAVRHLAALPQGGLQLLEERDFVRRVPDSSLEGEREFAFKHALTREVAYGSLTGPVRADLHAKVADWLVAVGGGRDEYASRVAGHYAEAATAGGAEVRAQAVKWLRRAGELAFGRFEMEDAAASFKQAAELEPDGGARAELWHASAWACAHRFDMDGFRRSMEAALEATADDRVAAELYAELALEGSQPYMWRHPPPEELVERWIERALARADPAGRARATALVARTFLDPATAADACREGRAIAARLDDPVLLAHAYQAQSIVERTAGRLETAAAWVERELALAPAITDPNQRGNRYFVAVFAYLRLGRLDDARGMAQRHDAIAARLSEHHEVHATGAHMLVETLACGWRAAAELSGRAEAAAVANAETPCQFNWRSLLMAALAHAELGALREAERLERAAGELVVVGGPPASEPALLRLALLRGDLGEVERLVAEDPGPSLWDVDYAAARLDALAALGDREAVEQEAETALKLGGYVEPFALRALGAVRGTASLLERAVTRFEALDLRWRADETRALAQRKGRRRSAAPVRGPTGRISP